MILVDTNVWIDHLHHAEPELSELLIRDEICCHDLVLTELALGSLKKRDEFLSALSELKRLPAVDDHEVRWFIEKRKLWGRGLSAVDVHLLASVVVVPGTTLWTRDKRLRDCGTRPGVSVRERLKRSLRCITRPLGVGDTPLPALFVLVIQQQAGPRSICSGPPAG